MTWTIEMIEQGKRLYAEGKSSGEIAKMFGLTRNQVVGVIHRRGWKGGVSASEAGKRGAAAAHGKAPRPARQPPVVRPKAVGYSTRRRATMPRMLALVLPPAIEPRRPGVRLLDLKPRSCRWPIGEATGRDQLFCSAPRAGESSYCRWHRNLSCGIGTPSERRAASI